MDFDTSAAERAIRDLARNGHDDAQDIVCALDEIPHMPREQREHFRERALKAALQWGVICPDSLGETP